MVGDKILICRTCGAEFVFTAGEQEFYAAHGLTNEPRRCKTCRDARRASGLVRETTEVICANCGAVTIVPFRPREDRPVYCRECYRAFKQTTE